MKLYSRDFVRRLKRLVRAELKADPHLRKRASAGTGGWKRPLGAVAFRWVVPLIFIALAVRPDASHQLFPALAAWGTLLMFFRASQIQNGLGGLDTAVFGQFPATDSLVFRFVRDSVVRTSLWLLGDGLFALSFFAVAAGTASAWFVAAGFSIVLWGATLAGAVVMVRWLPRVPYGAVAGILSTVFGVSIGIVFRIRPLTPEAMDAVYRAGAVISPPAWACQLAESVVFRTGPGPWLPLVLLLSLAAFSVQAYVGLSNSFQFWPADGEGEQEESAGDPEVAPERSGTVGDVEKMLEREKSFDAVTWLGGGLVERVVGRCLDRRGLVVANLLLGAPPQWTRGYPLACCFLLLAPICSWLVSFVVPGLQFWVLGIGFLIGVGMMTPLFGGAWAATELVPLGGRFCAVLSLWPVGLREVRAVILRINAIRFLFAFPWCLYVGAASAHALGKPILQSAAFSAAIWLLALLLQPFFLIFKYSRGTNDTSSGCLFSLGLIAYGILTSGAIVFAAVLSFQATHTRTDPLLLGAAFAAVALVSTGGEALYRQAYGRQQFDLFAVRGNSPDGT